MTGNSLSNDYFGVNSDTKTVILGGFPKINKSTYNRVANLYSPVFNNQYIAPVYADNHIPNRLRKAQRPYWRINSPYGIARYTDETELRLLGTTWVIQRCKSIILNEVLSNDYEFVATNTQDHSNETFQLINILNTFFGAMNRGKQKFQKMMEPLLNDAMDLGHGIGIKGFTQDSYTSVNPNQNQPEEELMPNISNYNYVSRDIGRGNLREVTSEDAQSFFIQLDAFSTPVGWWQRFHQGIPQFFSEREVAPLILNPSTYSPYGVSPVAVCKHLTNVLITSVINMEQYIEDGAIPPALALLSQITQPEFDAFVKRWDNTVAGEPGEIPVLSAGEGKFEYIPLVTNTSDIAQLETLDVYSRIVMSVFHVTPAELGYTDAVNKASAEQQAMVQKRAAVFPLMEMVEVWVNTFLLPEFDPQNKIEFKWIIPESQEEKQAKWNLQESQLNAGLTTVNKILKEKNEPVVPWGDVPFDKGAWVNHALTINPSYFGFPKDLDGFGAKRNYLNNQLPHLIQEIQLLLQQDKEITPAAISVLQGVEMMRHAMGVEGPLALPTRSVVESEAVQDAVSGNQTFSTTQEIFENFPTNKSIAIAGMFPSADEAFLSVVGDLFGKEQENKYQGKIDLIQNPLEREIEIILKRGLTGWLKSLVQRLSNSFGSVNLRRILPSQGQKQAQTDIKASFPREDLSSDLKEAFYKAFRKGRLVNNDGKILSGQNDIRFEDYDMYLKDYIDTRTLNLVNDLESDVAQSLTWEIVEGIKSGESIQKITKRVKDTIPNTDKVRARRIARTEVVTAFNSGRLSQLKAMGADKWEYHTHFDERNAQRDKHGKYTDPCRGLHGKKFKIDDTRYLPPVHPNCRCSIRGVFSDSKSFGSYGEIKEGFKSKTDELQHSVKQAITSGDVGPFIPVLISRPFKDQEEYEFILETLTSSMLETIMEQDDYKEVDVEVLRSNINEFYKAELAEYKKFNDHIILKGQEVMRMFRMIRQNDETGISGTGYVLSGVVFEDGTTVLRWNSDSGSTVVYDSYEDFLNIHVNSHPSNNTIIEEMEIQKHIPMLRAKYLYNVGIEKAWEDETYEAQAQYIKDTPGTERVITASKPGEGDEDDPDSSFGANPILDTLATSPLIRSDLDEQTAQLKIDAHQADVDAILSGEILTPEESMRQTLGVSDETKESKIDINKIDIETISQEDYDKLSKEEVNELGSRLLSEFMDEKDKEKKSEKFRLVQIHMKLEFGESESNKETVEEKPSKQQPEEEKLSFVEEFLGDSEENEELWLNKLKNLLNDRELLQTVPAEEWDALADLAYDEGFYSNPIEKSSESLKKQIDEAKQKYSNHIQQFEEEIREELEEEFIDVLPDDVSENILRNAREKLEQKFIRTIDDFILSLVDDFGDSSQTAIYTSPIPFEKDTLFFHGTRPEQAKKIFDSYELGLDNSLYVTTDDVTAHGYGSIIFDFEMNDQNIYLDPDVWHPQGYNRERTKKQYLSDDVNLNDLKSVSFSALDAEEIFESFEEFESELEEYYDSSKQKYVIPGDKINELLGGR